MTDLRRGNLVTVAVSGDYGKPRPAVVIQADEFSFLPSVTLLRLSGTIIAAPLIRVTVEPTAENGLRLVSQVMIDKALSVPREKIGQAFGRLDDASMVTISRALIAFFGLGGVTA